MTNDHIDLVAKEPDFRELRSVQRMAQNSETIAPFASLGWKITPPYIGSASEGEGEGPRPALDHGQQHADRHGPHPPPPHSPGLRRRVDGLDWSGDHCFPRTGVCVCAICFFVLQSPKSPQVGIGPNQLSEMRKHFAAVSGEKDRDIEEEFVPKRQKKKKEKKEMESATSSLLGNLFLCLGIMFKGKQASVTDVRLESCHSSERDWF